MIILTLLFFSSGRVTIELVPPRLEQKKNEAINEKR